MKDIVALNDKLKTVLVNVHTEDQCAGQICCIHNPSQHHMTTWPPHWNGAWKQLWRRCPHLRLHPDPDQLSYILRRWGHEIVAETMVHMCDGCCQPPAQNEIES